MSQRLYGFLIGLCLTAAGCVTDATLASDAQAEGLASCAGSCGGQAAAGCWCDDGCSSYGDCCTDYAAFCVAAPADEPWPGLSDAALLDALGDFTSGPHRGLSYDKARDRIFGVGGPGVDVIGGRVECVYTGRTVDADGTRTPGRLFNTEHSWPRSDGAAFYPAEGDLHHLFPSLAAANSRRSNNDFGETSCDGSTCDWTEGGSSSGDDARGRRVFKVRPARRGDIARAHFYFAVRYQKAIELDEEEVLRAWHHQDPPSDEEKARNETIEATQGNRNPFIDHPQLADRIEDF